LTLLLDELDTATREHMLREFTAEQSSPNPYVPMRLTPYGADIWPTLLEEAIGTGSDESLQMELRNSPGLFVGRETYFRNGSMRERAVNHAQASEMLATSEFNTWYVRGLSAKLMAAGVPYVEVYRAANAKWQPSGCSAHEGRMVSTADVYDGHRAAYWPVDNPTAFSVPFQPGCHHSIRRPVE